MRALSVLVLAGAVSACLPVPEKDWVKIPLNQAAVKADSDDKLKVGEAVYARTHADNLYHFVTTSVDDKGFCGTGRDGKGYCVLYTGLESMEVYRWTVGLEGGVLVPVAINAGSRPAAIFAPK